MSPSSCDLCPIWHNCQTRSQPPGPCCQRQVLQAGSPNPLLPVVERSLGPKAGIRAWPGVQPQRSTPRGSPAPLLAAAHSLLGLRGTQGTCEDRCSFHCFIWSLAGSRLSAMVSDCGAAQRGRQDGWARSRSPPGGGNRSVRSAGG